MIKIKNEQIYIHIYIYIYIYILFYSNGCPDATAFSPSVLANRAVWPALPASDIAAHAAHMLTYIAASDTATPAAIGSVKINSNCAQPTEGPATTPILAADPDGDVVSTFSSIESDSN